MTQRRLISPRFARPVECFAVEAAKQTPAGGAGAIAEQVDGGAA